MVPGKLNLLSRWPGEGLGGVVALEGLDEVRKGAGDEGVEDVVEDGLLLESRFMAGGCSCRTRDARLGRAASSTQPLPTCEDFPFSPSFHLHGWRSGQEILGVLFCSPKISWD